MSSGRHDGRRPHTKARLFALGRTDVALEAFDQALALDPAFTDACANRAEVIQKIERVRGAGAYEATSFANPEVLDFYKAMPFNTMAVDAMAKAIRARDPVLDYPVLPALLRSGPSVLEVGCGTGWMSAAIAHYYPSNNVIGIDFNPVAIEHAGELAKKLQVPVTFRVEDLFQYRPSTPCELVISLGVLHHTNDCLEAIRRVCRFDVARGGHVIIGLYHKHGRRPFLEHFADLQRRGASHEQLLDRYRELHPELTDETQLVSWFRDQVLHPHETQHTLEEILPVLSECGMDLVATSINEWQAWEDTAALVRSEARLYDQGVTQLRANKYFPGFFVFLARKKE